MADAWDQATLAARLLALDPGLGGLVLQSRAGPVRDAFCAGLPPARRLHPAMSDAALFGGLDVAATLASGRIALEQGLLFTPGPLVLAMAERTPTALAARLALTLDEGRGHTLIALDEGCDADERLPAALAERMAFRVDLQDEPLRDAIWPKADVSAAQELHKAITCPPDTIDQITTIAARLGIDSLRAPLFAIRAARAHAALHGRGNVTVADISAACSLTLAHRATRIPENAEPEQTLPQDTPSGEPEQTLTLPEDMILAAIAAHLPPDVLARLNHAQSRMAKGSGSGAVRKGNRRGRPLPPRPGRKTDAARIDIVATLRAAAPWQTIRTHQTGRAGPHVRAADIHLKRYEETSDRLLVFAVDASGSAALARLAEAKGAVELLLAQAYARRDHVALVAFRGTGAETLLPPTRSLVQTKRRLAGLPGGGGTPLATGLASALDQALLGQRKGMTPTICLLTDGRANIARDGSANRMQAAADVAQVACQIRAQGIATLVIDTAMRPEPALQTLAGHLAGRYLALPRADARRLSGAVSAALDS